MLKNEVRIKENEMWMMFEAAMRGFPGLKEPRIKITSIGNISDDCKDGVEFYFIDNFEKEPFCLGREEFLQKFGRVY